MSLPHDAYAAMLRTARAADTDELHDAMVLAAAQRDNATAEGLHKAAEFYNNCACAMAEALAERRHLEAAVDEACNPVKVYDLGLIEDDDEWGAP